MIFVECVYDEGTFDRDTVVEVEVTLDRLTVEDERTLDRDIV